MPPIPTRFVFRSRWAAIAWAAGICWMAVSYVGGGSDTNVDASNATDGNSAILSALSAEDD